MTKHAELKIASGPDRGKSYPLVEETVHIGSGDDNEIILDDEDIADTHLSITRKNGRYAIYTPFEGAIEVDGNILPSDQWVWLPFTARIQVTNRTVILFEQPETETATPQPGTVPKTTQPKTDPTASKSAITKTSSPAENKPEATPKPGTPTATPTPAKSKKTKAKKSGQTTVAKFITNREGESLVQLGADGKLPELNLIEDNQTTKKNVKKQASNPNLLYAVLASSFFTSLMLLFLDFSSLETNTKKVRDIRQEITRFYEKPGQEPLKYQKELRQAELAHTKGDYAREKQHYRNVLFMLQAQDINPLKGLTNDGPATDEELKALVISLISQKN